MLLQRNDVVPFKKNIDNFELSKNMTLRKIFYNYNYS